MCPNEVVVPIKCKNQSQHAKWDGHNILGASRKLFNKHSARIGESYNTNYIALRRSGQRNQTHFKEVYIILHLRTTLLTSLKSWRNIEEKNKENNKIFKNSGLDGSEYFTSLEAMKNNNSYTMVISATLGGNLTSVFFGDFSQIGSNFGESQDLQLQ
ncbi:hypothetical protein H5410_052287 [Solanum commersonii]|uniref:Uncharacterized protein n=1 Tax=Solanum commersonii TaxID=4109 RepID=A0A9J5X2Y5_SOLCO|nr:hypothetical protein H5410_052287 [Solanum commersonii]